MIFRFNVLICAVILWCYQWNVPISTIIIDRSLLCIVLFWFISIYTLYKWIWIFLVYFLSGHCNEKGFTVSIPGENELFQSCPCFFPGLIQCTACLLLQCYWFTHTKSTRHYQLLQHTLWMTTVSDSTKYTYQNICITRAREKENQRTREERLAYKE